ncbi:hypothetical protein TrST_g4722 [Triparma strigata]|uniref:RING-type domain-containing protein n=1 Tax=Triparma strigata TaxID=1606541 RepID=A0A9W7EEI2_9STRA|nr:hypothetical protein TrST_g4722 [Triparma strigata]
MDVSPPPPRVCAKCETSSNDPHAQNLLFKTSKVPSCYHVFCLPCLKTLFSKSSSFPCPICSISLNPSKLTSSSVSTLYCSTDANWRSKVLSVYNKTRDEFDDLKGYNDYLEEIEDIIYTLVNEYYTPTGLSLRKKLSSLSQTLDSSVIERQISKEEEERVKKEEVEEEKIKEWRKRNVREQEKNLVSLGERSEISLYLQEAKRIGFEKYVEKEMEEGEKEEGIHVWYQGGKIGPLPTLRSRSELKNWEIKRQRICGQVVKKSKRDREICFDEFMKGVWI